MKCNKSIIFSTLLLFASNLGMAQALSGNSAVVNMTAGSTTAGIRSYSYTNPNIYVISPEVNLFEGWKGGTFSLPPAPSGFIPPVLVFNVSSLGNASLTGNMSIAKSLRIGATAATGAFANYKLSVDGDMIAKRCVVQLDNWADFVFNDNYSLPELPEIETFIATHKHLPGVPSETDVKEKGMEVGEMNKILLQKVEELTLYVIKQQKEIDALKAVNAPH